MRVLETRGLVEIQHSSPQQFRAVPLEEATETLRNHHERRIERLRDTLDTIEVAEPAGKSLIQRVWALTGRDAIENRTLQLVGTATEEIVLVIGDESVLTENLAEILDETGNGVELIIGAITPSLQDEVQAAVPDATTFVSGVNWSHEGDDRKRCSDRSAPSDRSFDDPGEFGRSRLTGRAGSFP